MIMLEHNVRTSMKLRLRKIGNSWGVIFPIEAVRPFIDIGEVDVSIGKKGDFSFDDVQEEAPKEINRITGEVYEDKASKLDSLREMMETVNQKYETPLEPEARVEPMQYEPVNQPYVSRPFIPKPGVTLPAKREVSYEDGEKVELIYEDNPL